MRQWRGYLISDWPFEAGAFHPPSYTSDPDRRYSLRVLVPHCSLKNHHHLRTRINLILAVPNSPRRRRRSMVQPADSTSASTPETKAIPAPTTFSRTPNKKQAQNQDGGHREISKSSSGQPSPGSSDGRRGRSRTRNPSTPHNHLEQAGMVSERQYVLCCLTRDTEFIILAQRIPLPNVLVRQGLSRREAVETDPRDGKWGIRFRYVGNSVEVF